MGWEKGEGKGLGGERCCVKVYVPWPRSPRNSPLNGEAWARKADIWQHEHGRPGQGRKELGPDCNCLQTVTHLLWCAEGNATVTPTLSLSVAGPERSHRGFGPGVDSWVRGGKALRQMALPTLIPTGVSNLSSFSVDRNFKISVAGQSREEAGSCPDKRPHISQSQSQGDLPDKKAPWRSKGEYCQYCQVYP